MRDRFTGSPLLYTVAGFVSSDYTFSLAVFLALQILLFVGACLVLGFLYRLDLLYVLCFAMICLLGYQPVLSDLRVANVACVQLGALAALMAPPRAVALLWAMGWPDSVPATIILSWVPLWVALLIGLRRGEAGVPARPASDAVAPARSRRRRRAHA